MKKYILNPVQILSALIPERVTSNLVASHKRNLQVTACLATFTEKIFNGKLHVFAVSVTNLLTPLR